MQQTVNPAVVTPSGVRDGNPAALQGLCERRGASVIAYCREVCGPEDAARAAAEAFARFRAAVVALDDVMAIDPEALLLSATRHAAASLAATPQLPRARRWRRRSRTPEPEGCQETAELLIGRVEGTLSQTDQQRLTTHLEECEACRALKDMFRHAEIVYRDPGDSLVPPVAAQAIVDALAAAAPLAQTPAVEKAQEPEEAPAKVVAQEAPVAAAEPVQIEEPSYDFGLEDIEATDPYAFPLEDDEGDGRDSPDEPGPRRRFRRRPKTLEFPPVSGDELEDGEPDADGFSPVDMPPVAPDDEAAMARVFPHPNAPVGRAGRGLPRPPRRPVHPEPRHHGRLRAIVLPSGIVLVAVAGALGIAGVFGGDEASPPSGSTGDDQLFPTAALRAPARGTAAAAAAEIARLADLERRRAARARRLRQQGASAISTAGAVDSPPPSRTSPTRPTAESPAKPATAAGVQHGAAVGRVGEIGTAPGAAGPTTTP